MATHSILSSRRFQSKIEWTSILSVGSDSQFCTFQIFVGAKHPSICFLGDNSKFIKQSLGRKLTELINKTQIRFNSTVVNRVWNSWDHVKIANSPFNTRYLKVTKSPFNPRYWKVANSPFNTRYLKVANSPFSTRYLKVTKSPFNPRYLKVTNSPFNPRYLKVTNSPFNPRYLEVANSPFNPRYLKVVNSTFDPRI